MDLGPHAGFILVSYGLCFAAILGLIAWVLIDKARQEVDLKELADMGITRNQAQAGTAGREGPF